MAQGALGQGQAGLEAADGLPPSAGRTSRVSDAIMDKFEQRVRAVGLSEDMTYYFPTYGGWHMVPWEQRAPVEGAAPRRGLAVGAGALQHGEGV